MMQRLTQEQLKQIITEVERLKVLREEGLDQEQVKEILQELNLPPELLDEALIQLRRREILAVRQRRNQWIVTSLAVAVVVAIASIIFFMEQHNSAIARVSVQQDRITTVQDDGGNLKTISRQPNLELFYRVTLKDAPLGQQLNLSCNWIGPNGETVKENRYQTREINTSVWNTYCQYNIGTAANPGNWKVQMFLEGRQIGDETFEVK